MCTLLVAFSLFAVFASVSFAAPIDSRFNPVDYTSNGVLSLTGGDTIVFDTLAGTYKINAAPAVAGGTVVTSASGNVKMMLFNFDSINIPSGVTVNVTGNFGLVLGSKEDLTLNSNISVAGAPGAANAAGNGGPGAEGGVSGSSFNSNSNPYSTVRGNGGDDRDNGATAPAGRGYGGGGTSGGAGRGGSYGGLGGASGTGDVYGDNLLTDLYGGSGGGGGSSSGFAGAGGGGGGAIELTALGTITLGSTVNASGGNGGASGGSGTQTKRGGGGASGGGILVNASSVVFSGTLDASGGNGGNGASVDGSGGGGGRTAIYSDSLSNSGSINVARGTGSTNGVAGTSYLSGVNGFTPAGTFYWTGDAGSTWNTLSVGDTSWSNAAGTNTDRGYRPVSTSDVVLSVDTSVGAINFNTSLGANTSIRSLTFSGTGTTADANSFTINGNTLTVGVGGIAVQSGSAAHTINSAVTLGTAQSWTNSSGSLFTVNGNVSNGANNLSVNGSGDVAINGVFGGGAGAISKSGNGALTLAGNNTFSGGVSLSAGQVNINAAGTGLTNSALGTGTFTISGGAIDNTSGGAVVLATNNAQAWNAGFTFVGSNNLDMGTGAVTLGGTIAVNATANTLAIGGAIGDGGSGYGITKNGAGTLSFSGGATNTYTGVTTVSLGTLDLARTGGGNKSIIGDGVAATPDLAIDGGTVRISASEQIADNARVDLSSGSFLFNGSGLTETIGSFTNSGGAFSTNGANTLIGAGNTITWAGGTNTITPGGLVQDNDWVISGGTNTVEGGPAGTLQVQTGGSALHFSGTGTHGVTLNSDATSPGRLLLQDNVFVDNGGLAGTAQILSGGNAATPGTIDLDNDTRTFDVINGTASIDMLISARIANGALTKTGNGTLQLTGDNTFTGVTIVNGGTLELAAPGVLQNGSISVATGATFQQSGGTNNVTGTGTGNLTVAGSGVYQLQGGTLNFGDYAAIGSTVWTPGDTSTMALETGSQFQFTGGSLLDVSSIVVGDGSAFTQAGGNFYIGQNGVGPAAETTIDGDYVLSAGALRLDAFGVDSSPEQCCDGTAGLNDQLTVLGDATLDSVVSIDFVGFTPEFGDVFTLICADSITLGDNFSLTGGYFRVVPTGLGPGFPQTALQAIVPEPASVAVWTMIGMALLAGAQAYRRAPRGAQRRQ